MNKYECLVAIASIIGLTVFFTALVCSSDNNTDKTMQLYNDCVRAATVDLKPELLEKCHLIKDNKL